MIARLATGIAETCRAVVAVSIAILSVLIAIVVIQRYVTHTTPRWAEELPRVILVWGTFLGGVICAFDKSHLVTGILPHFCKNQTIIAWVERMNQLLIIAALALIGYGGWVLATITMGQKLTAIDVTAGMVYLALPVSCALTAVVHLRHFFTKTPLPHHENVEDGCTQ